MGWFIFEDFWMIPQITDISSVISIPAHKHTNMVILVEKGDLM